jgi:hypothetical protein
MTLNFEAEVNVPFDFDVEALAGEVINFTLEHEDFPYEPEVNLTLVDNEGIHAINKEFREIDRPTDVLSFPLFPMIAVSGIRYTRPMILLMIDAIARMEPCTKKLVLLFLLLILFLKISLSCDVHLIKNLFLFCFHHRSFLRCHVVIAKQV